MSWAPHLEHVASPFVQSYASGDSRVDVFVAIYPQSQPVELVSSYNLVSKPKTWYSVAGGFRSATIDSETISVRWSCSSLTSVQHRMDLVLGGGTIYS